MPPLSTVAASRQTGCDRATAAIGPPAPTVAVAVGVFVVVGVLVTDGVGVCVRVGRGVGVFVAVAVGVFVTVPVGVTVGVGTSVTTLNVALALALPACGSRTRPDAGVPGGATDTVCAVSVNDPGTMFPQTTFGAAMPRAPRSSVRVR